MPPAGAGLRAEQAAALAGVVHGRNADPRIREWIEAIDLAGLDAFDTRNVAEARRAHERATKIPPRLAQESARAFSEGQRHWAKAREANDFSGFAPALQHNIDLKREEAACLAGYSASAYDTLLDEFEPGATTATVQPLLEGLRPALSSLRTRIAERPAPNGLSGTFGHDEQLALSRKVATMLGYDFDAGRLDLATHPFSSGNSGDARITTRVDETTPLDCLYSTIHEVGHALYTQGAPDPFLPAADYCSMGIHESQSRIWENQIGRSRPFADWLYPAMAMVFGPVGADGPDALYAAVNRVNAGFIRTEADEVHYNLHILLRFKLERDLIGGSLEVEDLEEAWNARFERDFGVAVPDARRGVLQDIHWSVGLFGYFPTYSLGNIYAACLDRAMRADLPERDELLRRGETTPVLDWLRRKIHDRGRVLGAPDLIAEATGLPPSAQPLVDYLEAKFGALYDL